MPRGKRGNDAIWVIVDRVTKSALFLPVDLLRACALEFGGNWEGHLSLVEFTYNNSY